MYYFVFKTIIYIKYTYIDTKYLRVMLSDILLLDKFLLLIVSTLFYTKKTLKLYFFTFDKIQR